MLPKASPELPGATDRNQTNDTFPRMTRIRGEKISPDKVRQPARVLPVPAWPGGVRFRLSLPGRVDRTADQDELEGDTA